jgi:hypothetical protein
MESLETNIIIFAGVFFIARGLLKIFLESYKEITDKDSGAAIVLLILNVLFSFLTLGSFLFLGYYWLKYVFYHV